MFEKLIQKIREQEINAAYHLENIELLLNNKITTINYLKLLTDSILAQQLGFCIGAKMPNLKLGEYSNNIPSYNDYLVAFGETRETPEYNINNSEMEIDLSVDPVISCIWNTDRVKSALNGIGDGCMLPYSNKENIFQYDKLNHYVTHIYPLGINVVGNGNHSIFSGLMKKKGIVKITSIIDVSDGMNDSQISEGKNINKANKENHLGAIEEIRIINEIGKLMWQRKDAYIYPEVERFIQNINE